MGEFTPLFEPLYDRLTQGYIEVNSDRELVGGLTNAEDWVNKLFMVEGGLRHIMRKGILDRPEGSMRKKEPVRKGAYADHAAIAYARWMKPSINRDLESLQEEYESGYYGGSFEDFLASRHPRKPYERLVIVTPSALYSGYSGMLERFRFADHERTLVTPSVVSIARSMHRGLSERRFLGTELSDLFDGDEGPTFLVGSRERARSLVR